MYFLIYACKYILANIVYSTVQSHPVAAIFEEAYEDDSHDHHYGHHNESINESKEKCLASIASLILVERCVHTAIRVWERYHTLEKLYSVTIMLEV